MCQEASIHYRASGVSAVAMTRSTAAISAPVRWKEATGSKSLFLVSEEAWTAVQLSLSRVNSAASRYTAPADPCWLEGVRV